MSAITNQVITIVAVTYNHGRLLRCFCDNMLNQFGVAGKWKCIILHDGPANDQTRSIMSEFTEEHDFSFVETASRMNCWGHDLREIGLNLTDTPYIHITNADNQYCYGWLERVVPVMERSSPDLVLWDCCHSYTEFDRFVPELSFGKIDFCNYAVRTALAKELGFPWRSLEADGCQIEALKEKFLGLNVHKIPKVFAIHN